MKYNRDTNLLNLGARLKLGIVALHDNNIRINCNIFIIFEFLNNLFIISEGKSIIKDSQLSTFGALS